MECWNIGIMGAPEVTGAIIPLFHCATTFLPYSRSFGDAY
jgi:hypothetical protein